MPRRTLGVDLDSTLWDFSEYMHDALQEVCGIACDYRDVDSWDYYFTLAPKKDVIRAFEVALDPRRVMERELYPGVVEALEDLWDAGIRPHFITMNHDPEPMRTALIPWLRSHFYFPFGLTVVGPGGDKLAVIEEKDCFGMIDDRPDFIADVADAGYLAATKVHPWNKEIVEAHPEIWGFHYWDEVPGIVLANWRA